MRILCAYDAVYVLRPDSVARLVDIAGAVTDFKMGLVSAFCDICPDAQIIDRLSFSRSPPARQVWTLCTRQLEII